MENGIKKKTYIGSPQGPVISPLPANIYLHLLDCSGQKNIVNPAFKSNYQIMLRKLNKFRHRGGFYYVFSKLLKKTNGGSENEESMD